jgi:hypothetical protein
VRANEIRGFSAICTRFDQASHILQPPSNASNHVIIQAPSKSYGNKHEYTEFGNSFFAIKNMNDRLNGSTLEKAAKIIITPLP